ncbi:MAG: dTMP kinase [Myxococcales bacterium]|nr:dTMP kinase [Myxococcales bacterium]MCB9752710.1 dTMP kinase [Myxococcales bacterium]
MAGSRGRYIAIEGIDGSGTTLQTGALATALRARGHRVLETREPTGDLTIGPLIRAALATSTIEPPLDPRALALLFAADRIDHAQRKLGPAVADGVVVLSDRAVLSSLAYQSLDCELAWVRTINRHARAPDLCLFLEVPAEVAYARVQRRRGLTGAIEERFDVPELQRRVAANYTALIDEADAATLGTCVRVDGTRAPEDVTRALLRACVDAGL